MHSTIHTYCHTGQPAPRAVVRDRLMAQPTAAQVGRILRARQAQRQLDTLRARLVA